MKNLKVSMKIMLGFIIAIIISIIIGVVGIIGMIQLNSAVEMMYDKQVIQMPEISKSVEYMQRIRIRVRNIILNVGNEAAIAEEEAGLIERFGLYEEHMDVYKKAVEVDREKYADVMRLIEDSYTQYETIFKPGVLELVAAAKGGAGQPELMEMMAETGPASDKVVENLSECMEYKISESKIANDDSESLYTVLLITIIATIVIAAVLLIILALYISGMISKPLIVLTSFMKRAGETGDITLSAQDSAVIGEMSKVKDEIGQCISATAKFIDLILEIEEEIGVISNQDLTVDVNVVSNKDTIGKAMEKMVANLNQMFNDMKMAASQVNSGANQIASSAQALAQGATQQASSVQELTATVTDISENVAKNAENSNRAKDQSNSAAAAVHSSDEKMKNMITAMEEINDKSGQIGKIIKTIEDIAFQTNILALNAAVEAARAGAAGKGFAVVADEVRNLASKSAEAAKNTTQLIEGAVSAVEHGTRLADETAKSLMEIVESVGTTTALVAEINQASNEQATSVNQVKVGMDQISAVVQTNSATSEESAASAEELSSQSTLLNSLISKFKLKNAADSYKEPLMPEVKNDADYSNSNGYSDNTPTNGEKY